MQATLALIDSPLRGRKDAQARGQHPRDSMDWIVVLLVGFLVVVKERLVDLVASSLRHGPWWGRRGRWGRQRLVPRQEALSTS